MLSLHAADVVEPGGAGPVLAGGAVLVDGTVIAAVGTLESLAAEYPAARVRKWGGTLRPGRAEEAGSGLLASAALADASANANADAGANAGARERGEAARRAAHSLLTRGVTSVLGTVADPVVRSAVARSGLAFGAMGVVRPGARADFAVFAADGSCVATVVGGRLVHRLK